MKFEDSGQAFASLTIESNDKKYVGLHYFTVTEEDYNTGAKLVTEVEL